MTPSELIAKLQLSSRCDCPEFSPAIAREMLGAVLEMQRLNVELAKAVDASKAQAKEAPQVVVLRCPACRYEWALEGPVSAVDLAAMVCSSVHCRRTEPRPRLEVAR